MKFYYYYWCEKYYDSGYVLGFKTEEEAKSHAIKNYKEYWNGKIEEHDTNDKPLEIYTGE